MLYSDSELRRLMLKTLPVAELKALASAHDLPTGGTARELRTRLHQLPTEKIAKFIKVAYAAQAKPRIAQLPALQAELAKVSDHVWGTVQGQLDNFIQARYVRRFASYEELCAAIEATLPALVKNYALCSWFNHWTTVAIEDHIALHSAVTPTLKKVKGVDLFWLGQPWDLKISRLPGEWFKKHTFEEAREQPVLAAQSLYELQGSQRFGADNRLFIIIYDPAKPDESWKLKRNFQLLFPKLDNFFSSAPAPLEVNFTYGARAFQAHAQVLFLTP